MQLLRCVFPYVYDASSQSMGFHRWHWGLSTCLFNNHANQEHSLCRVQHQYSTRSVSAGRYEVPRINNYHGDRTIEKRLLYVLNTMPVDIRQETNKLKFKNKFRNYLLDIIV
ncbi:hypothetical protein ACJJTC_006891 [Scirpophaga incertulas]